MEKDVWDMDASDKGLWLTPRVGVPRRFGDTSNDYFTYIRPASLTEYNLLRDAMNYFISIKQRPEVRQLFEAHQAWNGRLYTLGDMPPFPPVAELFPSIRIEIEHRLTTYLLKWRMALDQLASSTSSQFGKASRQWVAYEEGRRRAYDTYLGYRVVEAMRNRVQHDELPPLMITMEALGNEALPFNIGQIYAFPVRLPIRWFLSEKKCPATLKQELTAVPLDAVVDIRGTVEESMEGFQDLLFKLTMANDEAPGHLARLVDVFSGMAQDEPVVVEWSGEQSRVRGFNELGWVMTRSTMQLDDGFA